MSKYPVPIVIVAAMSKKSKAIGKDNALLWHVPEDLKRFKALTLGHPVIMGRKTFESIVDILGKPLPKRTNIVLTRNKDFKFEGVKVVGSLEEGIETALSESPKEIHIGGGAEIYKKALALTDRLHLTFFDDDKEGDTFFPDFEDDFVVAEMHEEKEYEGVRYQWVDYRRRV